MLSAVQSLMSEVRELQVRSSLSSQLLRLMTVPQDQLGALRAIRANEARLEREIQDLRGEVTAKQLQIEHLRAMSTRPTRACIMLQKYVTSSLSSCLYLSELTPSSFEVGDLVMFTVNSQGVYEAYSTNSSGDLRYFLSEECLSAFEEQYRKKMVIFGRIIEITKAVVCFPVSLSLSPLMSDIRRPGDQQRLHEASGWNRILQRDRRPLLLSIAAAFAIPAWRACARVIM